MKLNWFKPKQCPGCQARKEQIDHQQRLMDQLLDRLDVPSIESKILVEDFVKDEEKKILSGEKQQPVFAAEVFDD